MLSPFVFFCFYLVWKCIFLCTLTSVWAQDHANVSLSLFSAFIFVFPLRFNFLTRLQRGDICHFVCWFGAGLPCGEGDTEISWVDNYLRVLFKDLCPSDMVWAAETPHSCPTSTSQCRCSSPARVQQGAGHQTSVTSCRSHLSASRPPHTCSVSPTVDVARWG